LAGQAKKENAGQSEVLNVILSHMQGYLVSECGLCRCVFDRRL